MAGEPLPDGNYPARLPLLAAAAACVLSAVLFFLGTGLHPIWWMTWLAPLPPLVVAPRVSGRRAFLIGAVAWFVGASNLWRYLGIVVQVPMLLVVIASALPACVFGAAILLHRRYLHRRRPWSATFVVPALWVTFEYAYAAVSPHGTFGALAYSQMDWLPIVQVASVAGPWGIDACLLSFPAAIATWINARDRRRATSQAVVVAVVLAVALVWGWRRTIESPARDGHAVRVALIASDLPANRFPATDELSLALIRQYTDQIGRLASRLKDDAPAGTDTAIVLPEKIGILSDRAVPEMDAMLQRTATESDATVVAGIDRGSATVRRNEARVYAPGAASVMVYDKHHLIPGLEAVDEAGTSRLIVSRSSGDWGVEICKDMDFPALAREYARDGIALLLVPAWDFDVDGWLHGRMAILRGVEGGFAIARAAKQGRLSVTDARGRVVAEAASDVAPFATLVTTVHAAHEATIYARFGNWFAWLSLIVLAGIAVRDVVMRPRRRAS